MKKPDVTIIIPTYNAAKYLEKCLQSLRIQKMDVNRYEIIIADGGSTDRTKEIIRKFSQSLNIRIFHNTRKDAESGKYRAIRKAKADIVVLMDSDNQAVSELWLQHGISLFQKYPDIWGVESTWMVNPSDPPINQYFAMMKIADPVARVFSPSHPEISKYLYYELIKLNRGDTPVIGANGFFWRKSLILDDINRTNKFEETNYVSYLVSKGYTRFGRLTSDCIYHYYSLSVRDYIKKRAKIANKFIDRKTIGQRTWIDKVGYPKFILSVLYNASIIGPVTEAVINMIRTGNISWVYHPIISSLTVGTYLYYYVIRRLNRSGY